ncbi:hypothetical protein [Deinococcus sp. SL84]|uniref:Cap15 family cyclic dinucleotide receptor domain-containing protein n=1 Tax=Deinococcus sp. SL84 TaxID=2994663 RepID=UPI002273714A|nr:hypothetical protein [Deinococcus sp. SL84]MCY1703656.1 hypothetical protein [Deinococcus sp. SL84]
MPPHVSHAITRLLLVSVIAAAAWGDHGAAVCEWAHLSWSPVCDGTKDKDWFSLATATATAFSTLLLLFQSYIWRTWIGRKVFGWPIPNLNGTWRGAVIPDSAGTGVAPIVLIPVYLVVHQTAFGIQVTQYTRESHSRTITAEFTQTGHDIELTYSYWNTPRQNIQHRSPVHYGTTILRMAPENPECLSGFYFTQRLTRGELSFDGKTTKKAHDFAEAEALTYVARPSPCAAIES